MSAITHLYAGVPVTDLHAGIDWYTRLFGRGPDVRAGDELREALAARHIDREAIETYSNGVRHVKIPDPDGNAIAFAEPPDVA
jgi:hypothetical protein